MIIDSSVLVDIDRGENLERLDRFDTSGHSISSATLMELSTGRYLNNTPVSEFRRLRENLEIIPVGETVADKAGNIMAKLIQEGQTIEINDVYIAATALVHGEALLTGNAEHFNRVDGLEVVNWEKL